MKLKDIQCLVFKEYLSNGYLEMWNTVNNKRIIDIAELGLIHTEIPEAMEEIRENDINKDNLSEELADIVIRVLNFSSRKNINLQDAILRKHKKNLKREKLHGKKV